MKKVIALGFAATLCTLFSAQAQSERTITANTFLRFESPYQSCSPERLALSNTVKSEDKEKHNGGGYDGDVEFTVFGGKVSTKSSAAQYYFPDFNTDKALNFNASFDSQNSGSATNATLWNGSQGGVATYAKFGVAAAGNVPANSALGFSDGVATQGTPFGLTTLTTGVTVVNDLGYASNAAAIGTATVQTVDDAGANAATTGTPNEFAVGTGTAAVYNTVDLASLRGLLQDNPADATDTVAIGDFVVDTNKNEAIMRPWNFGVGYAPNVQMGLDVSESTFVSTITPELERSQWGIGATWKQILSQKDTGFWIELSTALQGVNMEMKLNEVVATDLVLSDDADGDYALSWAPDNGYSTGNTTAPTTIAEAFAQDAWTYGKINGQQKVTRLADIEFKVGYQFVCEDNVVSNGFIGMVIPTGNKATATYMAEPIVGNGFHFGLMAGGTQAIQWNASEKTRWTMRSDSNFRYLFKNQQTRSFDTYSNGQWSRYMMVWPDYATEQAFGEVQGTVESLRAYTPGINVFTAEMNVTPQGQARFNQALVLETGALNAEFGWNFLARQAEKVELVTAWEDNKVAFVDASNQSTSLFNQNRTIYNDAYASTPATNGGAGGTGVADLSQTMYNQMAVQTADLNLDAAASPVAFINTAYLALGYAFNEEKSSVFSIGSSYEFSATNAYVGDWNLWGKFTFSY